MEILMLGLNGLELILSCLSMPVLSKFVKDNKDPQATAFVALVMLSINCK